MANGTRKASIGHRCLMRFAPVTASNPPVRVSTYNINIVNTMYATDVEPRSTYSTRREKVVSPRQASQETLHF